MIEEISQVVMPHIKTKNSAQLRLVAKFYDIRIFARALTTRGNRNTQAKGTKTREQDEKMPEFTRIDEVGSWRAVSSDLASHK